MNKPIPRMRQRRGDEVLLCRTGPEVIQLDGTYFPRWHLAKYARRRPKPTWPKTDRTTLWHYKNPKTGAFDVSRVRAYVPRCGSGQGYRATKVGYGKAPTCKRCLKKVS